jgi:hypothetical protein
LPAKVEVSSKSSAVVTPNYADAAATVEGNKKKSRPNCKAIITHKTQNKRSTYRSKYY